METYPHGTKSSLSKRDRSRLDRAIEVAKTSQSKARHKSARHGAIIVSGGRTISTGVNKDRNNVLNVNNPPLDVAVHAEAAALRAAGKTPLKGATIYIARVLRTGEPAMSKPCENCQTLLTEAGIRKIVYTLDSVLKV